MPTVEERLATLEGDTRGLTLDISEVKTDVKEIRKTLAGRPSWAITIILTVLSSSTVGLGVALATASR